VDAQSLETIYQQESRRVLATLIRLLGDFELAEEAMHEAFAVAVERWPRDGMPSNPTAWLVSTGRFKAIDSLRRRSRFENNLDDVMARSHGSVEQPELSDEILEDDLLRLIFVCCHPALPADARTALTLREVCGLTTEEIASAYLSAPTAIAQRIVRAKTKIRTAKIPYVVPGAQEIPERLETVLRVVYLLYNEGYSASSGETITRTDLSGEAIRLGRLLLNLLPDGEVMGLLALMVLHESRRKARSTPTGDLIRLQDQDRGLWDGDLIAEGAELVERALRTRSFGSYTIQAAIAAVHVQAADTASTNWDEIVGLYDVLMRLDPSPIVELNRAAALAMRDGYDVGLAVVDNILQRGELSDYHLAHAARGEFCLQLGRADEAERSFETALSLAKQEPERRFLRKQLDAVGALRRFE